MSILAPIQAAHKGNSDASREAKAKIIRLRAEQFQYIATELLKVAESGASDEDMTDEANMILAIQRWPA